MNQIYIKRFNSIAETELVRNMLEQHGIKASVQNTGLKYPRDGGDSYGADLFVAEKDVEKAKEILAELSA